MSLKAINARARVPSGLRWRARFSGSRCKGCVWTGGGGGGCTITLSLEDFFGDDEKKLRIPPLLDDVWTIGAGRAIGMGIAAGAGGATALN